MQDHGIWFHASQHSRVDSILLQPTNVCHPLRTYASLVHNIYFTNYAVNIGFYFVINSGCVAVFVGKRAVEKAATWKSPTTGLSHSAWKSRKSGGISHFFHRPDYGGFTYPIFSSQKNS